MKKFILLYSALSVLPMSANYAKERAQEFVILRNAQVLSRGKVDSINADLCYLQHYHDAMYDALCLALVMDANKIVVAQDVSLLESIDFIDEHHRIKDDVEKVLDARLLDRNSINPSPYEISCVTQGETSSHFDVER
jgi:hypothetical protein